MRSSACINCVRQLWFSVAPAVRFRDVAHPVSAGHKCSGKPTMRVSLCASQLSSPHPGRMLRRECLHLPHFLCASLRVVSPLFVVSAQVSGDVFVLGPKKGVPKLSLPSRQTRFVLELVLHASYCNSNGSVRPRERWVVSAYARGQGLKILQVFKRPFFMLVLHLLVQCSCRIL